jgi:hypothetical protein
MDKKKKSIYEDMKIELPLNGIELFWSDKKNPKSEYIKKRYLQKLGRIHKKKK